MESDRSSVSRSGERPLTRWRREQEPSEKLQTFSQSPTSTVPRPYSKMERPTSRRGIKTDITEYGISRPPTSGRNSLQRPPSAGLMPNRVTSAASRIHTMSSANLSGLNSGLPRNFSNSNLMVLDRPVTQHGSTAIRPGSSKDVSRASRQIQDKTYYVQILQHKIQELNQEISILTHEIEKINMEKAAHPYYAERADELAAQLAEMQGQLAEYNMALNKITSGYGKTIYDTVSKDFKLLNDYKDTEMFYLYQKHQEVEKKLYELNRESETVQKHIGNMDPEMRHKYDEIQKERMELQNELENLELQCNHFSSEKIKQKEKKTVLPIKQEAYNLYVKIFEAEQKRNKNSDDSKNSLTSREEKDKLLKKLHQESLDLYGTSRDKKVTDNLLQMQQSQLGTIQNPNGKETIHENKKQEDIMDIFMTSFEKNKSEEQEKMFKLQEQIVENLEQISNNIDGNIDSSILESDEMEILRTLVDQNFNNTNEKNFEELKNDNIKLSQILSKLETLGLKIKAETIKNKDNVTGMENATGSHNSIMHKEFHRKEQKEVFVDRHNKDDENVDTARNYSKLKQEIEQNELCRPISILEDKIERILFENEHLKQSFEKERKQTNFQSLLEEAMFLTKQYNNILINELKTIH